MENFRVLLALICLFLAPFRLSALEPEKFLTTEEKNLFYHQGYLLKKGCLSQEEIQRLDREADTLIHRALEAIRNSPNATPSEHDQIVYVEGARIVFKQQADGSISIARINGVSSMQPALRETLRSERMVRTFFDLLETSDLEHLIVQLHPKMPGDGIAYPRHRDIQFRQSFDPEWEDVKGNGSYAICILPVDPMTPENGGLWVDRNNYPEARGEEEDRVWIEAEPGDLLFMHPYLFHGSGPNLSPTASRRTLLTGFCAFGANHKSYPGSDINVRLTLEEDGSIHSRPAPWSTSPSGETHH